MITDIFKDRIAEQRQIEFDEAEKNRKKAEELATVMKKAEDDISVLLKKAPASAFKIDEGLSPAIIIERPENERKGDFTKEYVVFTGMANFIYEDNVLKFATISEIGTITLSFSTPTNEVDFSMIFNKENATVSSDGDSICIAFLDFKAE